MSEVINDSGMDSPKPFAEARGCAAIILIREMLEALESAEDEMTCGWREPRSTRLTLADVQPAIRKAKKYLKQHNYQAH